MQKYKSYKKQHKLNKGDKVEIFEYFRTKQGFEGRATLKEHLITMFDGIERWDVKFDNGDVSTRLIDPGQQ